MKKLKKKLLNDVKGKEFRSLVDGRNYISEKAKEELSNIFENEMSALHVSLDGNGFRIFMTTKGFECDGSYYGEKMVTFTFIISENGDLTIYGPTFTFNSDMEITDLYILRDAIKKYQEVSQKEFCEAYQKIKEYPEILLSLLKINEITGYEIKTISRIVENSNH